MSHPMPSDFLIEEGIEGRQLVLIKSRLADLVASILQDSNHGVDG